MRSIEMEQDLQKWRDGVRSIDKEREKWSEMYKDGVMERDGVRSIDMERDL